MVDLTRTRRSIQDSGNLMRRSGDALGRTQERLVRSESLVTATLMILVEAALYGNSPENVPRDPRRRGNAIPEPYGVRRIVTNFRSM